MSMGCIASSDIKNTSLCWIKNLATKFRYSEHPGAKDDALKNRSELYNQASRPQLFKFIILVCSCTTFYTSEPACINLALFFAALASEFKEQVV